ncbi:sterol homeostasis protein [Dimargaris verticillata]|uniref:Protein ARV n=1 Tax=Dimargaris verticillata TaxID=2761393 RepID=A0A9W8B516_9FUNG|nr:sterol homeostasis protein [Dimargaris verticillata]
MRPGTATDSDCQEISEFSDLLQDISACHQFADRYVEHDAVIIFIDMMLHKPQVYRHLLFNRSHLNANGLSSTVLKLAVLLILFDVYIKWFRLEKLSIKEQPSFFYNQSFYVQYLCILLMSIAEFASFYLGVQLAVRIFKATRRSAASLPSAFAPLVISSFGKLLTILIVIWNYSEAHYSWMLNVLVFTSNAEALSGK